MGVITNGYNLATIGSSGFTMTSRCADKTARCKVLYTTLCKRVLCLVVAPPLHGTHNPDGPSALFWDVHSGHGAVQIHTEVAIQLNYIKQLGVRPS